MADATHFPIVEYEADGVFVGFNHAGGPRCVFQGRRSIDLRWVATAAPGEAEGTTVVALCGDSATTILKADYADFMRDWCRAKGC